MYDSQVLERESTMTRVANPYNNRYDSTNNINMGRTVAQDTVQNFTPYYMPTYQVQNDYYVQPQSDNISMVNPTEMGYMAQNAINFQQAPYYNPQYVPEQMNYNVSANAQSYPTHYYSNNVQQTYSCEKYYAPIQQESINDQEYEKIVPQKTKVKNKMTKMLIAVYFLIIAVCAALIIVNVVAAAGTSEIASASVAPSEYSEDAIIYSINDDGNAVQMKKTAQVVDYSYDTSTNWFDKLCDKIGNILG